MPRVTDLMEVGFNSLQAKHLGAQAETGNFNNLTATGNNSQVDAYQLIANYNIFTTVGATTNSCKLPEAESDPHGNYYILNLGANSLYLFPAVGDSFNDLSANTAIEIPTGTGVILVKQTITSWQVQATFGSNSPDLSGYVPYTGATGNVDLGVYDLSLDILNANQVVIKTASLASPAIDVLRSTTDSTTVNYRSSLTLTGDPVDGANVTSTSNTLTDSRILTITDSFENDTFTCLRNDLSHSTLATNTLGEITYYALSNTISDVGFYNNNDFFGGNTVTARGLFNALTVSPKMIGGTALNYTAIGSDVSLGGTPVITSGSYVGTYYGNRVTTTGTTVGTTTFYAYFNSGAGYDTNWCFYNNSTSNNYLGTGTTSIGTTTQSAGLSIVRTTEQLRVGYSTSLYWNAVTAVTTGITTLTCTGGTSPKFVYASPIDLRTGTATANTYPLKFTSGALLTTPVAGVQEFLTDKVYTTITTGTARKEYALNDIALTSGRVPFSTTNGRLTDLATFTYATNRLSPTYLTLSAGTATAGTCPLVMTSGTLLTTAIAGGVEFLTDKFYGTITTGAARKELTLNDIALTSGRVPFTTTNGRLTDSANLTFSGSNLTVSGTISASNLGVRTSFTPSDLTPTAGTVTGGTKTGWYLRIGDMIYFQASYVGFTQNTSTSTQYTASLPITGVSNIAAVPFTGYDASTGLMLTRCASSSSTQYILDRSGDWTAGQSVNLYISGYYYVN